MTDITIPPEAVEAAARTAYAQWVSVCVTSGGVENEYRTWADLEEVEREEWCDQATATLRAGIAAWPRSYSLAENDSAVIRDVAAIILPLPQEKTNAES